MPANPLLAMPQPRILLRQVKDTAPWLWPIPAELRSNGAAPATLVDHPLGWWRILDTAGNWNRFRRGDGNELADYLALCLACHHATVATFVPTDVDSKIRGHLWRLTSTQGQLERLYGLLVQSLAWDPRPCSRRVIATPEGLLSGHDGERLGSLVGVYGRLHERGCTQAAVDAAARIDGELQRHERIWLQPWSKRERCQVAAVLTHNAGDVDQGLSYWPKHAGLGEQHRRWSKLAHSARDGDGAEGWRATFCAAAQWYRGGMAAEGHRHYPLRELTALRRHPDLLLPISPFLEDWGTILATHPCLDEEERLLILGGLIQACRRVANQRGYQRAIRGFLHAHPDPRWMLDRLPVACTVLLGEADISAIRELSDDELDQQLLPAGLEVD